MAHRLGERGTTRAAVAMDLGERRRPLLASQDEEGEGLQVDLPAQLALLLHPPQGVMETGLERLETLPDGDAGGLVGVMQARRQGADRAAASTIFALQPIDHRQQPSLQGVEAVQAVTVVVHGGAKASFPPGGDLADQGILGGKVPVELALAGTGPAQDLLQAGAIDALGVEEFGRRFDDASTGGLPLGMPPGR